MSVRAQEKPDPLLIAAASDLAPLEISLSDSYFAATGQRVKLVLGSSGMLARQIQQGAPFDVYLSANEEFVHVLVKSGHLLGESVRVYAAGRLALWSRSGRIRSLEDLADRRVRHVSLANPDHAPYGVAARDALKHKGLWDTIRSKVVYGENVRQAFQFAASGNAEAVITAWTLVLDKGGVLIPQEWHKVIRQAGGVVKGTRRREAALRFLEHLNSEQGRNILYQNGLFPVTPLDGSGRRRPAGR